MFLYSLYELHGYVMNTIVIIQTNYLFHSRNTETWQCSKPCCLRLWQAPLDVSFDVDLATMRLRQQNDDEDDTPVDFKQNRGFVKPHPMCQFCGAPARPAYVLVVTWTSLAHSHHYHSRVLMFDDVISWIRNAQHERRWQLWKSTVKNFLKQHPDKKLVILEIGAGVNVTF